MSNYVANKIICKKKFYEKFFLDLNAFGDVELDDYIKTTPYITFNKLYNVKSINEYRDKYGTYIYYGFGHSVKELNNDLVEIKFQTSKYYPICAIKKAIELDNSIVWYAVEENLIYISKFEWNENKVVEKTLYIETDKFNNWYDENICNGNTYDNLEDCDDAIWYLNDYSEQDWKLWKTDDLIKRYISKYPTREYYEEMTK